MAVNSFNAQNPPLTTKGDLFTFSTIPTRLAVGATNGHVLTVDSTAATGLKYAAVAATKNFSLLGTGTTTSGSTVTVSGISGQDQLFILLDKISTDSTNNAEIIVRINTDAGNNYNSYRWTLAAPSTYAAGNVSSGGTSSDTEIRLCAMSNNASSVVNGFVQLFGCNTAGKKMFFGTAGATAAGGSSSNQFINGGFWNSTSTVTSISVLTNLGSFDAGSFYVYGSA